MGDEMWLCITRILTYLAAAMMAGVAIAVWVLIFLSDNVRPIQLIESAYYMYLIGLKTSLFAFLLVLADMGNQWVAREFGFFKAKLGRGFFCGVY